MPLTPPSTRRPVLLALTAAAVLLLPACGDGDHTGGNVPERELTVVSTDWNGWDRDHVPTPETATVTVAVGNEVWVEGLGAEEVRIEITDTDNGAVVVETSQDMAPASADGGLSLNDLEDTFRVWTGEQTSFATPSTDGGITYELSVARA